MKRLLLTLILFVSVSSQTITEISGTVTHGDTIIISGSGFGTKSPVAPLIYDDFEDNSVNTTAAIGTWDYIQSGGYTCDSLVYSGSYSMRSDSRSSGENATLHKYLSNSLQDGEKLFLYLNRWWEEISGNNITELNQKFFRIWPETPSGGTPNFAMSWHGHASYGNSAFSHMEYCEGPGTSWLVNTPNETWYSEEFEFRASSATGENDGYIRYQQAHAGGIVSNNRNVLTRCADHSSLMNVLVVDNFGTYGSVTTSQDNIYIDRTWARVIIGSHSTYSTSTQREIQIPHTTWNNTTIHITVNAGRFAADSTAYLYVIDDDGTASSGYQITLGASGNGNGETPATGLMRGGGAGIGTHGTGTIK